MITYTCTYLGAAALSLLLTPLVMRLALRHRLVDRSGVRKIHSRNVPRIGGLAIIAASVTMMMVVMRADSSVGATFRRVRPEVIAMLAAAGLVAGVGFIDDVRNVRARFKLLAHCAAAVAVCTLGIRIQTVAVEDALTLELGWLSWPLTIFWIVGITNAVNLIDGLDGLATGICAATCGVIAALAVYTGQPVIAVLMLALLGSLTGFLYFNFNPARIFMGDSGTYFLGFVLATSSVICATKASTLVGLALPMLALGIPIFDTFTTILRRFAERRSIFAPDRSHIHHRLLDMGLRQRHVVLLLYGVTLLAGALGMFMMVTRNAATLAVFACVLLLIALLFRIVGAVSLRRSVAALRRNLDIALFASHRRQQFDEAAIGLQRAGQFEEWWQRVCAAAEDMDLLRLSLTAPSQAEARRPLSWHRKAPEPAPDNAFQATMPVRPRNGGDPWYAEVQAEINGSVQMTARTVFYFCRLLEENPFPEVPKTNPPPSHTQQSP